MNQPEAMNQPDKAQANTLSFSWKGLLQQVLRALGSLRITVFLLTLALILVLIATLQQSRRDIYQVKQQHFRSPVVFIEFQELLTPAWFPDWQEVGGGFLMPSGAAILIAMLINLFCATPLAFGFRPRDAGWGSAASFCCLA